MLLTGVNGVSIKLFTTSVKCSAPKTSISLVKDASKFCLLGKAVKTQEIPPIPVINVYDNWALIDLSSYIDTQKNIITISGITDDVILEITEGV